MPKLSITNTTLPKLAASDSSRKLQSCGAGFYPCSSGGCCQTGYICGVTTCSLPSSCPSGDYECSASVGGGCCPISYTCGFDSCTSTSGSGGSSGGGSCRSNRKSCGNGYCCLFGTTCGTGKYTGKCCAKASDCLDSSEGSSSSTGLIVGIVVACLVASGLGFLWRNRARLTCCTQVSPPAAPESGADKEAEGRNSNLTVRAGTAV